MPTYDYVCENCGHEFELFQSMKEEAIKTCPACKKESARRQIGFGAGIIFKGSGFYETDYKRNGSSYKSSEKKEETSTQSKEESSSASKTESKNSSTQSKAESAT